MPLGEISKINRYPVKSFAGETLETCSMETYGLYGDRCHAFIDETKEGWDSYFTARSIPSMLAYKAKIVGERLGNELPEVSISSPDGRAFTWNEALLEDIQRLSKKKMSMRSYTAQSSDLMAVDAASILIITDYTLRKLEAIWEKALDPRRFRANLLVTLNEKQLAENEWIGKRVSVGDAELQVDSYCERCSMITLDPDTLERDASLLKKINEEMELHFGVYASVKKTGQIHVGDPINLIDG
ncbi:MOSC domain-containing protein [Paenibacillus sp. N3.4]|nr:MOSC domain-containing protein [Paenibacillus sp. N3.4]